MPSDVTVKLVGRVAAQAVRMIARNYALLAYKGKLPSDTVNAPWASRYRRGGDTWATVYRKWMKEVDRERADYRKTLEGLLGELPPLPECEWKPCDMRSVGGKLHAAIYSSSRAADAASAFADLVMDRLAAPREFSGDGADRPGTPSP